MDSNMILTWSIVILTIISILLFIYIYNRNSEKRIYLELHSFAKENNSMISHKDHWNKTLIGIDNKEVNKLFFIRSIKNKITREIINLSEVKNCHLVKMERTIRKEKEKVNVIDKIELIFLFIDHKKPELALEFYNNDYDQLTLLGELQLAEKWSGNVKNILIAYKDRGIELSKSKLQASSSIKESIIHEHAATYSFK